MWVAVIHTGNCLPTKNLKLFLNAVKLQEAKWKIIQFPLAHNKQKRWKTYASKSWIVPPHFRGPSHQRTWFYLLSFSEWVGKNHLNYMHIQQKLGPAGKNEETSVRLAEVEQWVWPTRGRPWTRIRLKQGDPWRDERKEVWNFPKRCPKMESIKKKSPSDKC